MKKSIQVLVLIILPLISISQEQKFLFGADVGLNFAKFNNDSLSFRSKMQPMIGVFGNYKFSNNFFINLSSDYSIRSSFSHKPYLQVVNQYVDAGIKLQYEFYKSIYVNAGTMYSFLFDSKATYNNDGSAKFAIDNYSDEISVVLGMGIRLSRSVNFEFNYFVPTSKNIKTNFQLGIVIEFNNKKIPKPKTYNQIVNEAAIRQIKDLKQGVLLVRLHRNKKSIDAMRRVGKTKKAEKEELKKLLINESIVEGFKRNFDFCDFQFFYAENTEKVKNKDLKNIFLNDLLKVDSLINIDTTKPIFIAEFNFLDEDTAKYFSEITYRQDKNGKMTAIENYYASSSMSFQDLVIKNSNFIQLQRPFPYCTRGPNFIRKGTSDGQEIKIKGDKNPYSRRIFKMNNNLHRFYRFVVAH